MTAKNRIGFLDSNDHQAMVWDESALTWSPSTDAAVSIGTKSKRVLVGGTGGTPPGVLFTAFSGTEQNTFTTRVSLLTGATIKGPGTAGTVPAGALNQIGRFIKWDIWGYIGNTGTPNFTFDVALGSTVVWTTASFASVAITGSGTWRAQGQLVTVTTGATGTVIGQGSFTYHQTVLLATGISTSITAAETVDLTAAKAFTFNATCGTPSGSNKVALTSGIVLLGG